MSTEQFTRANFCIDAIEGNSFAGFTNNDDWNGWACPYFTKQVAEAVLIASEKNGFKYQYDENKDAFIVTNQNDSKEYEPEIFEGIKFTVNGEEITVYGVGAYSWIWEVC